MCIWIIKIDVWAASALIVSICLAFCVLIWFFTYYIKRKWFFYKIERDLFK